MGLKACWARITGADKKKKFPDQQASMLGRIGDYVIIFPYGMYCDLPDDVLLRSLGDGAAIPVTVGRPAESRGEVVIFHPVTGSKIVMKNGGDVDITAPNVNINANVKVVGDTEFTGTVKANGKVIDDTHGHLQSNDSNGDSEAPINGVT